MLFTDVAAVGSRSQMAIDWGGAMGEEKQAVSVPR